VADYYGVKERLIADVRYLAAIGGSALTDEKIKIPTVAQRTEGVQPTYVPFRNTHLIAIAVSWGEVIGAQRIMIGIVEEDAAGYPDCRRSYLAAMNEVIRQGTRPETEIEVEAPLIGMTKTEIVRRGAELKAPFELTWSCYRQEDVPCGDCLSCELRRKAFAEAAVADPLGRIG
jgi:7-cyano-7-deazaguanine synthase